MKSLTIVYFQYGSFAMIFGALVILIITAYSTDLAFGFQITERMDSSTIYGMVKFVSFPWSAWIPSAVPSLELIQSSHSYRLGNEIHPDLIKNAKELGSWWRFLAMSLFVWGAIPRAFVLILADHRPK